MLCIHGCGGGRGKANVRALTEKTALNEKISGELEREMPSQVLSVKKKKGLTGFV